MYFQTFIRESIFFFVFVSFVLFFLHGKTNTWEIRTKLSGLCCCVKMANITWPTSAFSFISIVPGKKYSVHFFLINICGVLILLGVLALGDENTDKIEFLLEMNKYLQKLWSVQFSSVTQSCPTLRPHESQHSRPPCPSSSLRLTSIESVMPSAIINIYAIWKKSTE